MTPQRKTYALGESFPGRIGRTYKDSEAAWPAAAVASPEAPNVVVILLDDVGYAQLGCFGGLGGRIRTPHIDRLAQGGLRFRNFHVAPMCSPTRAALLTGRNPHTVGVGMIMEMGVGYPGYDGHLSKDAAMAPAILADGGYTTSAFGKWHLVPPREAGPGRPTDRWPLRQGFDRFYGFMSAYTDQYAPALWDDNHYLGPRGEGQNDDYHLTEDLVDSALSWLAECHAVSPDRPFFQYLAPGAMHQPHQVSKEWSDRYRGVFAAGWDVIREETLARQKELGVVPKGTELPPPNPGMPRWDDMPPEARELLERQMEVFAGFLEHTDAQIGRYVDALAERGLLENTVIMLMSDNGASGEGTLLGESHHSPRFNGSPQNLEEKLADIDDWGGPSTSSNYATGWAMAGNAPNRWYKQFTHEGGTRSPLIVHWPEGVADPGAVRSQFHFVTDVLPTVLELTGTQMPQRVRGYEQIPLEGCSFGYAIADGARPTEKESQFFELLGHRAIWADGWKAVTAHLTAHMNRVFLGGGDGPTHDGDFETEEWELYHLDEDYSETRDLAKVEPERLARLVERWWEQAESHSVLPLDDRFLERYKVNRSELGARSEFVFDGPIRMPILGSPNLRGVDHSIVADVSFPDGGGDGVIVSDGGPRGGYALGVVDGKVTFGSSWLGREVGTVCLDLPVGRHTVRVDFVRRDGDGTGGTFTLRIGDTSATLDVAHINPVAYQSAGEGFRVGCDLNGVLPGIRPPAVFPGEIHRVVITRNEPAREVPVAVQLENALAEQ